MTGDLTRWNRAALKRFRYIDGNAVTYLDRLRARLALAYTAEGETVPRWSDLVTRMPVPANETATERQARLLAQYADERRDHAWEILRAFARSTHVLTEYLDAYANETFIGTATQWDSVRKLIELLDARPAPPASARTDLALDAKVAGVLAAGFQVKNKPTDGSPPAIFETVETLEVDPALNLIRPTDWNRSQEEFDYVQQGDDHVATFPLSDPAAVPTVGDIGVMVIAAGDGITSVKACGVQVVQALGDSVVLMGQSPGTDLPVKRWRVSLRTGAELIQTPRLAGSDVVILTPGHNLAAGRSSVTWQQGGSWRTAKVMAVDGTRVRLAASQMPAVGSSLFLLLQSSTQVIAGSNRVILPNALGAGGEVWTYELNNTTSSLLQQIEKDDSARDFVAYQYSTAADSLLYVPGASDPVATVESVAPTKLVLGGKIEGVAQGDWIVSAGAELQAVRVDAVTEQEGDTAIDTTPAITDLKAPVHLKFAESHLLFEHDRNRTLAFDAAARSDQVTRLLISPEAWPDILRHGRQVVIEAEGIAHAAEVTAVDAMAGFIEVAPTIPGTELTEPKDAPPLERWSTTISANVVTADHGETQPLKILGSGDATRSNQVFEAKAKDLSFLTDPLMPAGVRAGIDIFVGQRQWRQVGNLRDSGPTDADFEVRVSEVGPVSVHFGDGRNGRRLPTDTDNVRIRWRKGVGSAGNLGAGSLVKVVKPDPLIAGVRQPVAAAGGSEAEGVASLRDNAAAGLLTLGRAVSASDFGKLAARNAQVLQATSHVSTVGAARGETVSVVVVPAGGRMGTLADDLETFLLGNALPGVTVDIQPYVALPLSLNITLRILTGVYDPDAVADAVEEAIVAAYALEAARLGAPLFRSQILSLIEGVEGVENATAVILTDHWAAITPAPQINRSPGTAVRNVRPRRNQMIHYDSDLSSITITTEDFSL